MYRFMNFPKKGGAKLFADVEKFDIRIRGEHGSTVCEIPHRDLQPLADDICQALAFARECGYADAQADIRKQLGIKD